VLSAVEIDLLRGGAIVMIAGSMRVQERNLNSRYHESIVDTK
jgi:hypothetical protein